MRAIIRDAVTGEPVACTVTITDANGKVVINRESFRSGFRCDGRFTRRQPPGRTRIRVRRGFETRAVERELDLGAGQETELAFSLERVVDLRRRGWYAGDSHAHGIHELTNAWYCVRLYGDEAQQQRAISGAFFFEESSFRRPVPAPARVSVRIVDAATGRLLAGTVTEVTCRGTIERAGRRHRLRQGEATLVVPGTVRLRAEARGYAPAMLSPFLDCPALVEAVTGLDDAALLEWATFERLRRLLAEVRLTFALKRQ